MNDEQPKKKAVSQSQEMRFALHNLWSAKVNRGDIMPPFEMFYEKTMQAEIKRIRDATESINLGLSEL